MPGSGTLDVHSSHKIGTRLGTQLLNWRPQPRALNVGVVGTYGGPRQRGEWPPWRDSDLCMENGFLGLGKGKQHGDRHTALKKLRSSL